MRKLINQFCNFIFGKHNSNSLPRYWILATDMVIVALAYIIANFMLYFNKIDVSSFDWDCMILVLVVYLIAFLLSRTYDGMLRYSGFNDVRKILFSCSGAMAFLVISKLILMRVDRSLVAFIYPRYATIFYHFLVTIVLMVIMRLTIRRLYNEVYKNTESKLNAIIYGAGDAGTMLQRSTMLDTKSAYKIKAFIDDNPVRIGNEINGVRIYSSAVALDPSFVSKTAAARKSSSLACRTTSS